MELNDEFTTEFSFSQEEVNRYAELTGDKNPLHLDADYAATTAFRRPIVHGMLSASVISKVLGMDFPGEGTIFIGQTLEFKRPMYPEEPYQAKFTVSELNKKRHLATIKTELFHGETNKLVLSGEAQIMHRTKIVE